MDLGWSWTWEKSPLSTLEGEICHFPTQLCKLKLPPRGNFVRKQTCLTEGRRHWDHLPSIFKYEQTTEESKKEQAGQDQDKDRPNRKKEIEARLSEFTHVSLHTHCTLFLPISTLLVSLLSIPVRKFLSSQLTIPFITGLQQDKQNWRMY